jgi:hypothetical protein
MRRRAVAHLWTPGRGPRSQDADDNDKGKCHDYERKDGEAAYVKSFRELNVGQLS